MLAPSSWTSASLPTVATLNIPMMRIKSHFIQCRFLENRAKAHYPRFTRQPIRREWQRRVQSPCLDIRGQESEVRTEGQKLKTTVTSTMDLLPWISASFPTLTPHP